ncbi:MAG TPA: nucleotide exchange factor GrpE [Mycobacterium sp.]|nr:nucleotide exchange factor GrpE [Mycobacterium sp.]HPZ96142.1 nucleotide exchange factor GrpE [Mycobacterium sp.]HQE16021.1 nucleotide exchange factor GrpE [Mycobacterium sp.]
MTPSDGSRFDGSRSDEGRDVEEPVTVTDKRRIDPETGQVREAAGSGRSDSGFGSASGAAPQGVVPEAASAGNADKVAELTADLQRVQADFANYRKRALRDQEAVAERAKAVVLGQLLGVLDDLDRARSHGDLEGGPLKSVADKLASALSGLGLVEFGAEGEEFDPALHEAVQHEGDGSNPVIGNVMRKGYKLGEQVLRHAMVGVVDAAPADQNAESDQ